MPCSLDAVSTPSPKLEFERVVFVDLLTEKTKHDTTFSDHPVVWARRDGLESYGEETRIEAGINNVSKA